MGVKVRLKDGHWYIFLNHKGQRAAHKCVDEQHALDTQKAVLTAIAAGQFDIAALRRQRETVKPPEPKLTVEDYYNTVFKPVFLDSAVAASTAAKYANHFKNYIRPGLGTFPLDGVDPVMEEFVSRLVKSGLAKATIESVISNLRAFFNHAKRRKHITDNPACGLSQLYSQAKAKHEVIEPLTREEVPVFLAAVRNRKESRHHYALFFTAIHTGVREGELAGLQIGDMDFNGKYVLVQRSIDRAHRKIVPTKSKRIRRVDLSDELIAVLREHVRQQKEFWFKEGKAQPIWLFPNREGGWSDMANISERHYHPCLEKAGLHQRRFHDLRHSFASLLLTKGAPMQYVSEQMGHSSIQLTVKLYGHLQPGANRHWMNSLPGLSAPPLPSESAGD
jgi:integrase